MNNTLYILTLNYNNCKKLSQLKNSLLPNLTDINYTWMIKDNGSTDDSYNVAKSWNDKQINVIDYKDNRQNFSEGMNYLFYQIKPKDEDYIMLLNNDIIFNDTSSIKKMLNLISKDKNVGIVGAKLYFPNSKKIQHAGIVFEPPHNLPLHFRIHQEDTIETRKNRLFQAVTGAVMIIRAGDYKNIYTNSNGIMGMDEGYRWAFDDVAMCLSVNINMKKKIVCCGQTDISHESSATLKTNPVNKLFMNHNVNRLIEQWKGKYIVDKSLYFSDPKYNIYG